MPKSKKVGEGEITKNAKLAEAIREPLNVADIPTVLCQGVGLAGGGHPDILISNAAGKKVVVECKQNDPQLKDAKSDAEGRLQTGENIIGLAAVSYNGTAATDDITWAFRDVKAPKWEKTIAGSNDLELRLRIEQAFFPNRREVGQGIARIRQAVDQFTATCADMPGMADRLAKALKVDYGRADDGKKAKLRHEMPVVAGLVLMQAMIFHRLLAQASAEPFDELDGMAINDLGGLEENVGAGQLRSAWREIQKVNYVAIFSLAEKLLTDCAGIFPQRSIAMFSRVADSCLDHAKAGNDFAGSIFHRHLADQKTLAAYYTSAAAATLLAGVMFDSPARLPKGALKSADKLKEITVMDPACGTGTLLLAAAGRLREMSAIGKDDFHRVMMENVVKGMDILDVGVAMAAASLGMMSPTVPFKHCGIRAVDMRVAHPERRAVLGSLEWLNESNLFKFDAAILRNLETGGSDPADAALDKVSAVIMNPPFAVGQDGNTSFSFLDSKEDEAEMKKAYAKRGAKHGFGSGSGAGPGFLQLAAKRVARGGRFGTIIGVALGTGGKAYGRARRNLSRYFDIDTVIISRDPRRINFSDSTNLNELMVVGTRNNIPFAENKDAFVPRDALSRKTAFVILTRNPATQAKAKQLARLISEIDRAAPRGVISGFGEYVMEESRDILSWSALNFSNPELYRFLCQLSAGNFSGILTGKIPMVSGAPGKMSHVLAESGDYRLNKHTQKRAADDTDTDRMERRRGTLFLEVADKGKGRHPATWGGCPHDTFGGYFAEPDSRRMEQPPNVWMNPLRGFDERARDYFNRLGGAFGVRVSFGVNTSHALAAKFTVSMPSATTFIPLNLRDDEDGKKTKAMVAWLNSSLGTALIVKHSTAAAGAKVQFTGHGVKTMAWLDVSRLEPESIAALASAYDEMVADEKKGRTLDRIANITKDRQRAKLDELVAKALGIKGDFGKLREMMSREMIFTGHRQDESADNGGVLS